MLLCHRCFQTRGFSFCQNICLFYAVPGKILPPSRKQVFCETTLLKQAYNELNVAGKDGLTIIELARQLRLQILDGRNLLRNLCRKGCVVSSLHDKGKSSMQRYTLLASSLSATQHYCRLQCIFGCSFNIICSIECSHFIALLKTNRVL